MEQEKAKELELSLSPEERCVINDMTETSAATWIFQKQKYPTSCVSLVRSLI
jgi:hypothetical protein